LLTPTLLLAATVATQRTWIVDGTGTIQADFKEVKAAVEAAAPGDTILVRSGPLLTYKPFTVSKGVRILPDRRGWGIPMGGSVVVQGVPAGQTFVLKNAGGYYGSNFFILDCQGLVCFERCVPNEYIKVVNSRNVVLNGAYATGMEIDLSVVTMNRSPGTSSWFPAGVIQMQRSTLFLGTVEINGYNGNADVGRCVVTAQPGPGIVAQDSTIYVGQNTRVIGGTLSLSFPNCSLYVQADSIRGTNVTVYKDPRSFIRRITGTVNVIETPIPVEDAWLGDQLAGRMDLDLNATPGASAVLVVSAPAPFLQTSLGYLWLDPLQHIAADAGVVDGTGHRRRSFLYPDLLPVGTPMLFQTVVVDGSGMRLTTPSVLVKN
jgi:hypothetical protein